jgi:hypothetical protein
MRGQLDGRLSRSPQWLRGHKALESKRLVPRKHEIDGPGQLLGEHSQRLALAMLAFELGEVRFAKLVLASEEGRRL